MVKHNHPLGLKMNTVITISKLMRSGTSEDGLTSWITFKQTNEDGYVIFWGSSEEGYRNIHAVKHQKLPMVFEVDISEDCIPTEYVRSKYGASLSITEHTWIQINPEC